MAALVLAAAVALSACGGGDTRRAGGRQPLNLQIGDIVPLSGQLEAFGGPGQKAADLAIEQIRKGIAGAKADHKVTIKHVNDRSEAQTSLGLAATLARGGATCLTGPWSTTNVIGIFTPVVFKRKLLDITPAASSDALANLQIGGFLNRTIAPDRLQGAALAQVMASELGGAKGKTVNVGAFKSIYGKTSSATFTQAWRKLGGKVGATVIYESSLPSYEKEAKELVAGKPDAWAFFDFVDTYIKVTPELVRTRKWSPKKTFVGDALAVGTLPSNGAEITEGVRGVAPGAPATTPLGKAFNQLYESAPGPKNRQTYDAQSFDAVVLCYLSAVAAGSTSGKKMSQWVRKVSAPPGKKYTWQELPAAIRALQGGNDIDYEGASGAIDMDGRGDPRAGTYDVFRVRNGKFETYAQTTTPGTGIVKVKPQQQIPYPEQKAPAPPAGATGTTGATGATGVAGKTKRGKARKQRRRR